MNQTKVTVKIFEPLFKKFNQNLSELHIKRDSFLNAILKSELPYLEAYMSNKKLSAKANKYIAGELKRMGTITANIVIDSETIDQLNIIVKNSNMVRDAFFNRVILFLLASDKLLETINIPKNINHGETNTGLEFYSCSPIQTIHEVMADPFYYLRDALNEIHDVGLYEVFITHKHIGFSCYLPDREVPKTEEFIEVTKDLDSWLNDLLSDEGKENNNE